MKIGILIYTYILFLLSTPNFIFPTFKKITMPIMLLYSLIFTILLYFTYDLVNNSKETFQVTDIGIDGIKPLTKVFNSIMGENDSIQVNIDNDLADSQILGGASDKPNTPEEEQKLKPISKSKPVNNTIQEEKLKKNKQLVNQQYKKAYDKFFLTPFDDEQYNQGNNLTDGCQADYDNPEPCCGQPGVTVSANHICSKGKPICAGYLAAEDKLGKCKTNGGTTSGQVSVLGKYNMQPWSMKNSWIDKNAKWIWFSKNADIVATPNSSAVFQYVHFFDKTSNENRFMDIEITIACDCYCYVEFKNNNINLMEPIVQVGTGNGEGRKIKSLLESGANVMNIFCYNNSYENKPAGLLVTATSDNEKNILFSTDESWSWYQTAPIIQSLILKNTDTYLPIIALWNNKYKTFLTINANDRLDLLKTKTKKLNNTFACERVYFQYQKNSDNTISLYSCANRKYISLDNELGVSSTKGNNEKLVAITNKNNCVSFYFAGTNEKHYLSIKTDSVLEITNRNDDASQWEMIYIDIINVGKNRQIDNVPKYIGYVGLTPLNVSEVTNGSFLPKLETDNMYNYTNKLQISRTDSNSGWTQDLLLPGINDIFLEKVTPNLEMLMNFNKMVIRQIVLYYNKMLCMDNKGIVHSRDISSENRSHWKEITNAKINIHGEISGIGGNMVIGKFDKKDVLFAIGPLITVSWSTTEKYGAIYYRSFDSLHDPNGTWKLYSSQIDGSAIVKFTKIYYCKKNEKIYGFSRGKLFEINYNNGYIFERLIKTSPSNEYIIHPLKKYGGYILGINSSLQIFRQSIDFNTNKLGEIMIISNNVVEVTKMIIICDIIFALGKRNGKIYYIPLAGGTLKEFSKNVQGNLIDIVNYNDVIYAINNNSDILKTQIVL